MKAPPRVARAAIHLGSRGPLRTEAAARRFLLPALWLSLGVLLGYLGTRQTAPTTEVEERLDETPEPSPPIAQERARATMRAPKRDFLVRPVDLFVANDPAAESEYKEKQSRDLIGLLQRQINEQLLGGEGTQPEEIANRSSAYLQGFIDSVVRTAPDLAPELADEVQSKLCDRNTSDAHSIVLFRLVNQMPELGNSEAFDCFFSNHAGKEDAASWEALDAFSASGLPESKAVASFRANAKAPQTLMRSRPRDEITPEENAARLAEMARKDPRLERIVAQLGTGQDAPVAQAPVLVPADVPPGSADDEAP